MKTLRDSRRRQTLHFLHLRLHLVDTSLHVHVARLVLLLLLVLLVHLPTQRLALVQQLIDALSILLRGRLQLLDAFLVLGNLKLLLATALPELSTLHSVDVGVRLYAGVQRVVFLLKRFALLLQFDDASRGVLQSLQLLFERVCVLQQSLGVAFDVEKLSVQLKTPMTLVCVGKDERIDFDLREREETHRHPGE